MAKLAALPSLDIISGLRGVIDYYVHHQTCPAETGEVGTPCARRWPRSPGHRRAPAVEAQWANFTFAAQNWDNLSPEIQAAYEAMATGSALSGRDMFARSYLKGLFTYPHL